MHWRSVVLASTAAFLPAQIPSEPLFDLIGVVLRCPDVEAAADFYVEALAFESRHISLEFAELRHGRLRLVLIRGDVAERAAASARMSINMQVSDLADSVARARRSGGQVRDASPREFSLGQTVDVLDPAGHEVHLLTLRERPMEDDAEARVFNIGCRVPNLSSNESWYAALGFEVFSRDYLPATLPMKRHGASALVFHSGAAECVPDAWDAAGLMLGTSDLKLAAKKLVALGLGSREVELAGRPALELVDPAGVTVWLTARLGDVERGGSSTMPARQVDRRR